MSAESGSLSLCTVYFLLLPSDPTVTSNALAIRIIFPLIGVMSLSFKKLGLPASLGKQKRAENPLLYYLLKACCTCSFSTCSDFERYALNIAPVAIVPILLRTPPDASWIKVIAFLVNRFGLFPASFILCSI